MAFLESLGLGFLGVYEEYVLSLGVLIAFLVTAKLVGYGMGMYHKKVATRTRIKLDDMLVTDTRGIISLGFVLLGIYAAAMRLSFVSAFALEMNALYTVVSISYVAFLFVRIINVIVNWYMTEISAATKTKTDEQFLPIIKKVSYIAVFAIALIWMLGQLGIEITTLVATLGIGGIAIALAVQPILSNMFAGAHIVIDRPIKLGDYVELESGDRGTVVDIGWRSTKIRNYMNNLVIIPNAKIAAGKIVNYYSPSKEIGFKVDCGVSYRSDLEKVERVTIAAAKKVLAKHGGVKDFVPKVRFREFGDSAINFSVIFRTKTFGDKFTCRHEFIKELKKQFDKERIEIAFPQLDVHISK